MPPLPFHPPKRHRCRRAEGFLLVEVAIAVVLLSVISFVSVSLTATAMAETNWSARITLADAYLDREAALMRRLTRADLNTRGFTAAGTTATAQPLAYTVDRTGNNPTPDTYTADTVARTEVATTPPANSTTVQCTYTVTVQISVNSQTFSSSENSTGQLTAAGLASTKTYKKSRTVQRIFN